MELDGIYAPYIEAALEKWVAGPAVRCRRVMRWSLVGKARFETSSAAPAQAQIDWDAMMLSLPADAQYQIVNVEIMFYPRITVLLFDVAHGPTAAAIHAVHEMTEAQRIALVMSAEPPAP